MKKPKLYIVSQVHYFLPFKDMFELVENPRQADVLMFTGGADISPQLYGEHLGMHTFTHPMRDAYEKCIFEYLPKAKRLGICRGAQFLCAMSGGKLVQHVTNHGRWHDVVSKKYGDFFMSSTHHQMMRPGKAKHELIAWAEGRSGTYLNGNNNEIPEFWAKPIEPEIAYFPETKSLCIQGHPEMMSRDSEGVKICRTIVKDYLF